MLIIMNELEIRASWLKIQINSSYGINFDYNNKLYEDYKEIKSKIGVIKLRTSKIKKIWKTDGIV
jgi:hypothetical protein